MNLQQSSFYGLVFLDEFDDGVGDPNQNKSCSRLVIRQHFDRVGALTFDGFGTNSIKFINNDHNDKGSLLAQASRQGLKRLVLLAAGKSRHLLSF